jgi:hypothetical protein
MAQRGLLDYLLFSTWEYRWEFHRDLFRADRRPHAQRQRGTSNAHADKGHGRPTGSGRDKDGQKPRGNAFIAPDDPLELGGGGGSGQQGIGAPPSAGAGVRVVRSAWGHAFLLFEAPAAAPPAVNAAAAAQAAAQAAALTSARSSYGGGFGGGSGASAAVVSSAGGWSAWDKVDLELQHATAHLLFSFRPVGDVVEASRYWWCGLEF